MSFEITKKYICLLIKIADTSFNLSLKYTEKLMDNFFFECPGKVFLIIEKVLEKTSEDQP